jgi:hypothetical protein
MRANQAKLVNITALSEQKGIAVRTLRTLVLSRKIPFLKLGHRMLFFDPDKVDKALERFEVREVGSCSRRGAANSQMEGGAK